MSDVKQLLSDMGFKKATVTQLDTVLFFRDSKDSSFAVFGDLERIKRIVGALLDAGFPVACYWKDVDYAGHLDPRLPPGTRT